MSRRRADLGAGHAVCLRDRELAADPPGDRQGAGQRVVQGRSLSGLRMAQMWVIRSPVMANANTVTVTPSCWAIRPGWPLTVCSRSVRLGARAARSARAGDLPGAFDGMRGGGGNVRPTRRRTIPAGDCVQPGYLPSRTTSGHSSGTTRSRARRETPHERPKEMTIRRVRLDYLGSPLALKLVKAHDNDPRRTILGLDSALSAATQELVNCSGPSQYHDGCGFCTDMHIKDALHAGKASSG